MNIKEFEKKITEEKLLPNFNDDQNAVIESKFNKIKVNAGAGAGKTSVLIEKIVKELIDNDGFLTLKNFSIITFTNKATEEVKERLAKRVHIEYLKHCSKYIGNGVLLAEKYHKKLSEEFWVQQMEIIEMCDISTIHGFCEKLLRKYGFAIGVTPNFTITSIFERMNYYINDCLNDLVKERDEILLYFPIHKIEKVIKKIIIDFDNKGVSVDNTSLLLSLNREYKYIDEIKKLILKTIEQVLIKLNEYKKKNNIITINDLINKTAELLKNIEIAKIISKRYQYIFIDEFQDTNSSQNQIVEKLTNSGSKVVIVGDKNQSIYRFRGAEVKNITNFSMDDNSDKSFELKTNYRTDPNLLEKINAIFETKLIAGINSDKEKICNSVEVLSIAKIVEANMNIGYKNIAILCRNNYEVGKIREELNDNKIPSQAFGGGLFGTKEVIDLYKLFNFILFEGGLRRQALKNNDFINAYERRFDDIEMFLKKLSDQFRFETLDNILEFILKETEIEKYYQAKYGTKNSQEYANIVKLKELATKSKNDEIIQPIDFFNNLNIWIEIQKDEALAEVFDIDTESSNGLVRIMTVHAAKGLEFDTVILANSNNNLMQKSKEPLVITQKKEENLRMGVNLEEFYRTEVKNRREDTDYIALNTEDYLERLEEEKRIFYVAVTRAKHKLIFHVLKQSSAEKSECWSKWWRDGCSLSK